MDRIIAASGPQGKSSSQGGVNGPEIEVILRVNNVIPSGSVGGDRVLLASLLAEAIENPEIHSINVPVMSELVEIEVEQTWFYWSDVITNNNGESLQVCWEKYGTGGWKNTQKDLGVHLVYLDASQSDSCSFLAQPYRMSEHSIMFCS